jgi:ATP-dependent DNA helicase RecG
MAENQLQFDFSPPSSALPQLWTPDDIYAGCDQKTIETFAEDRRVERKRFEVSQKDFAAYLSMWSNTQPSGGVIFVGVDNDGSIRGCAHGGVDHLNEFETAHRLCPDARYEVKRVAVVDVRGADNFILAVRVFYRSDKLVETVDGSAFIREGDEKRLLGEAEKREIRLNKGELDAETERVSLRYPDDFNSDLLGIFREAYIEKRSLPPRYTTEDILQLCKLGQKTVNGFAPNLACAILFASDPRLIIPGAFIRVFRYEGAEEGLGQRMNAVADQVFDGPLPLQIADAERFIESQVRNFTRLGKDARFMTRPEYPKDVA